MADKRTGGSGGEPPVPVTSARRQAGRVASTVSQAGDGRRCAWCGGQLPARRRRFCCDLCRIRGQKAERVTETGDFGRFVIRTIQTMARRVGASDLAEFGLIWEMREAVDRAAKDAIDGLRAAGFTWEQIAAEINLDRKNRSTLYQWWARREREQSCSRNLFTKREQDGAARRPPVTWLSFDDGYTEQRVWDDIPYDTRWHYHAIVEKCCATRRYDGRLRWADALRCSDVPEPDRCVKELIAAGLVADHGAEIEVIDIELFLPPEGQCDENLLPRKRVNQFLSVARWLGDDPGTPSTAIDELRLRRLQRRMAAHLPDV